MMWPFGNPMIPAFMEARRRAANIPGAAGSGDYTIGFFAEDFPQFFKETVTPSPLLPEGMLKQFIDQANDSISPGAWGGQWRYAAGLFVAHWAALYLKTYDPCGATPAAVASKAGQVGNVASATLGDTSISYDNGAVNAGTEKWGMWNATQYGAQLATMARMIGIGGTYAI